MCGDITPLNFRTKEERDNVTPDPYYDPAPGWSTLSGGRKPYIQMPPADFVEKLMRAASCVPLIREVRVFVVDSQGNKRRVTLEELKAMNITVKPVPNLYKKKAPAAAGSNATSHSLDLAPLLQRQQMLEEQLATMKDLMEKMASSAAADSPPATGPSKRARTA